MKSVSLSSPVGEISYFSICKPIYHNFTLDVVAFFDLDLAIANFAQGHLIQFRDFGKYYDVRHSQFMVFMGFYDKDASILLSTNNSSAIIL